MISFVYYFHTSRTENLRQSLRMLFKREKVVGEVILVCNDQSDEEFEGCRLYNMNLSTYQKPKMCNLGVSLASHGVVAILDSDRVLPEGYFGSVLETMKRGQFVSCLNMWNLEDKCTDEKIDQGDFDYLPEERSEGWEIRRKNLFSGNTTFFKDDYLSAGGMDESFVGYGFADNDMTLNVIRKGFSPTWRPETELHLYHEKTVLERGRMVGFDEYKRTSQSNLCRFLKKWKMKEYWEHCGCSFL